MSPVPASANALVPAPSVSALDTETLCRVMTVHKATFLKLVQNSHDTDQLADFFRDIAVTYQRMSEALRREVSR